MLRGIRNLTGAMAGVLLLGASAAMAAPTPLAQWQFNGNLNDSIGGFNLTFGGTAPISYVTSGGHQALSLDGVDQHASVAVSGSSLDFDHSSFSISAWATIHLPPDARREGMIVGRLDSSSLTDYAMTVDYLNQTTSNSDPNQVNPVAYVYTGPGSGSNVGSTINYDQYVNLVLTYDQPTHTLTLYRNGDLRDSKSSGVTGPYANSSVLDFGNNYGTYLKGDLDEVRIYGTALTQEQVTDLYNGGNGPAAIPEPASMGLIAAAGLLALRRRRPVA